jgi:hypothetical protein
MGVRVHKRRALLVAALILALCGSALYTRLEARDSNMLTLWVRLLEIEDLEEVMLTMTGSQARARLGGKDHISLETLAETFRRMPKDNYSNSMQNVRSLRIDICTEVGHMFDRRVNRPHGDLQL